MLHRMILFIFLVTLIAVPASFALVDGPHDATNGMQCASCHEDHPSANAYLLTPAGSTNLCKSCHNPLGVSDAEVHSHAGKADTVCTDCHDPHKQGQKANGSIFGKYVRTTVNTPNNGPKAVVFKGKTGLKSFADGDATYDGICEVCHTTTLYHRNNSTGDHSHYAGQDCTQCHVHKDGYKTSSGSCIDCHKQPQGTNGYRRQVLYSTGGGGDFTMRSHHVNGGTQQTVSASDCAVCHDTASHGSQVNGVSVRVKNPDGGAAFVFGGSGAAADQFCMGCHDSNGAAGNMRPLSDGKTPSNVSFGGIYATSLHRIKGMSCYGNGGLGTGCHANAHGSMKRNLLGPYDIAANVTNLSEEEEGFCIKCHGSAGPGKNIGSQLTKTRTHGMTSGAMSGRHLPHETMIGASFSGTKRHVECEDCHNQHWIQSGTTHTAGTNLASAVIKYVPRIQVTYGTTAWVVPTFTPKPATDTTAPKEYEICFKCHSSWAYGSTPPTTAEGKVETDQSVEFNPRNKSFHPVVGQISTNSYTIPTATNGNRQTMNAPWDTTTHKLMYCSDCHKSETSTDPKGPHGSANNYMLPTSDTERTLCLMCHKSTVYRPSVNPGTAETGSRFDQQTTGNSRDSHYYHTVSRGITCRQCHGAVRTLTTGSGKSVEVGSMHGTNTVPGLLNGKNIKAYRPGYCAPTCHGAVSYTAGAE